MLDSDTRPPAPKAAPADDAWEPADDLLVTHPDAVAILWHPDKRVHLKPFMQADNDMAGASRELGIKKGAMGYWINRLLEAGLLRPTQVEKRGRHRVARYRCVARRLRVGLADAPVQTYEGLFGDFSKLWMGQVHRSLARALERQAPTLELSIKATPTAGLSTNILPREGVEPPPDDFIYYWARLWLTEAEREALAADLNALYDRYGALSDPANKPHATLLHMIHVRQQK